MKNTENFKELFNKIKGSSHDYMALFNLDIKVTRIYDNGGLDVHEFRVLDEMILDRMVKLEQ